MLNKFLLTSLQVVYFTCAFGQFEPENTKILVGVNGYGSLALLFKAENPNYRYKQGTLKEKQINFVYGGNIHVTSRLKNNLNIGAELGYKTFNLSIQKYLLDWYIGENTNAQNYYYLRSEAIDFSVYSAALRMEFFQKNGNNPIGFYHAISAGYSLIQFANKSYYLSLNEKGNDAANEAYWTTPEKTHFYHNWPNIHGITIQHEVGLRYPVTPHLAINFGTKSIFGFEFGKSYKKRNLNSQFFDYEHFYYEVRRLNLFSFNLNAGITYLF